MSSRIHQEPSAAPKKARSADWLKPAGMCCGILLVLIGCHLIGNAVDAGVFKKHPVDFNANGLNDSWNLYFSGVTAHRDLIAGFILLGSALGVIGVAWGGFDFRGTVMAPGLFYGVAAGLAVFIWCFFLNYGMHQIGGNDHSLLVDLGWRLLKGQKAYLDFPCTTPVAFVLGSKFAYQWFGVSWRSIIEIGGLFAVVSFAWSLLLLEQLFGRSWVTLLWAITIQLISPMLVSFWWYNPATDVSAAIYILSATFWFRRPADKTAMVNYGAALLLMATMKPNVAGVLILGFSAVLFISPAHRLKVIGVSLASAVLFMALLYFNNLSLTGMLAGFMGISSRGASLEPFLKDLAPLERCMAMVMLASFLLPAVLAISEGRKGVRSPVPWIPVFLLLAGLVAFARYHDTGPVPYAAYGQKKVGFSALCVTLAAAFFLGRERLRSLGTWIPIIGLLAGIYGFLTNSEQKLVDMPAVVVSALLLAAELRSVGVPAGGPVFQMPLWKNRYLALVCVILGATGIVQGATRDRIQSTGPVQFFEWDASHTVADGFFKGLHCGNVFEEILKEETDVINREPSSNIWFGARMQWGYAAFNKPPPTQQPVIWDGGYTLSMYSKEKEADYFNNFLQSKCVAILFKNDVSGFKKDEVQRIAQQYNVDQSYPLLTILRPKP
jgi:hypothetical protein